MEENLIEAQYNLKSKSRLTLFYEKNNAVGDWKMWIQSA